MIFGSKLMLPFSESEVVIKIFHDNVTVDYMI